MGRDEDTNESEIKSKTKKYRVSEERKIMMVVGQNENLFIQYDWSKQIDLQPMTIGL